MFNIFKIVESTSNPEEIVEIDARDLITTDQGRGFIEFKQPVRVVDGYAGEERGTLLPVVKVFAPQIEVIVPSKGAYPDYRSYEYVLCARNDIVVKGDTSWNSINAVSMNGNVFVEHAGILSRLFADNGNVDLGVQKVDAKGNDIFVGSPIKELTQISGINVRMGDVASPRFSIQATGHLQAGNVGAKYGNRPQIISATNANVQAVSEYASLNIAGNLECKKLLSPRFLSVGGDLTVRESFEIKSGRLDVGGQIYMPKALRSQTHLGKYKIAELSS